MKLKRLARGRYITTDGRWLIESDCPSYGELKDLQGFTISEEAPRPSEWFVYDATSSIVADDDYGPPDAVADGFPTLRAARQYLSDQ